MKIAVTIESFGSGGAEASTRQIAEGLRDRGHAVTLLTGYVPPGKELPGVPIEAAGASKLKTGRAIRRYRSFAIERMRAGGFDTSLSVTTLCPARVVQPRAGIYREMGPRPGLVQRKRRAMWAAEADTLREPAVKTWVAISRFMRTQIVRHTGRAVAGVPVIVNAAPAAARAGAGTRGLQRDAWTVPRDALVFLFPSADLRRKGWRPLARAWPRVHESADRARLVALSAAVRGVGVAAAGPADDMPAAFAAADVLVLPSFYDPAAKAVPEALHAGVPVITTRTNGSCDLIEGSRAGRIVEDARDTDALAAAMLEFCDPAVLAEARAATAAAAAGATMDEHVDKLLAVLEAAAG